MKEKKHQCPICSKNLESSQRYPNYICDSCVKKAVDENGRVLQFYNVDLSGGLKVIYQDTRQERDSHDCFIEGVKCFAQEAYFGGIVVQPTDSLHH